MKKDQNIDPRTRSERVENFNAKASDAIAFIKAETEHLKSLADRGQITDAERAASAGRIRKMLGSLPWGDAIRHAGNA